MASSIKHDSNVKIHVDASYTTGEDDVREAISKFAGSRRWCVIFGVVSGISLGAGICAVTTFTLIPSLSTHLWTVVAVTTTVNGVGITLFAITTVRAVRDYRKKESLVTGIKEYDLEKFGNILLNELMYWEYHRDYVLGIQSEDMPHVLNYISNYISEIEPQKDPWFINGQVHAIANFIRERPEWEGELANAGYDEKLLQTFKEFVCPVIESKKEDI